MSPSGPARTELLAAGLVAAFAVACSSDSSNGKVADGGALGGGGTAATSGTSGGGASNAGSGAGGRGAGGRSESGGSAGISGGKGGIGGAGGTTPGCTYGGTTHPIGSSFPAADGCNTCTCGASSTGTPSAVSCTKRACIPDAGTEAGAKCTDTPAAAAFCVHGPTSTSAGEPIKVGDKIRVQVQPRGCFSSSCTKVRDATCSVRGTMPFVIDAHFCLESSAAPGVACTADCSGGGSASCEPAAALMAGQYTVQLGGLSVTFTVPGTLSVGGECIGSPF